MRKKIPGFEKYEVDVYGNVYSFTSGKEYLLKALKTRKGYLSIRINSENQKKKTFPIHRLVAKLFIENPENKPQVNHIDGNKQNNHMSNLEWVTCKENIAHAIESGLLKTGIKNANNMFSDIDISNMLRMFNDGKSVRSIARLFGVNHKTISLILKGETYSNSSIQKCKTLRKSKFTYDQVLIMKKMKEDGLSYRKIAKHFNSTHSTIKGYINGAK